MTPDRSDDLSALDPLDESLAACLRAPRAGREAALAAACAAHPEHAGALRQRLEALQALGLDDLCADADEAPHVPRTIDDYELGEVLGVGGMGVVHRAWQKSLDREVVVKLVRPDQLDVGTARERFRREAEAVARLAHPGIVAVHAVGEHAGVPYIVMESVDGETLGERLAALAGRAPDALSGRDLASGLPVEASWVEVSLRVALQVAEALEHAADRGVLHRDVKPSNVLVSADGRARVIDFGLAVTERPPDDRLTREGAAPGTLLYMAPEQLERGRYDARSEVYALGVTLYELLTLQLPFHGADRSATERRIRAGGPDPIPPRNRAVGADVDAVVRKALAVEPGRRYADMRAFAEDLSRLLGGLPVRARPDGALYRARRWATREPALAAASAAALALALVTPAAIILQQRAHNREVTATLEHERAAREEAEDLSTLLADLFEAADPNLGAPTEASLALLTRGVERLETRLADQPLRRARAQAQLGRIHGTLGLHAEGEALLLSALAGYDAGPPGLDAASLAAERSEVRARLARILELAGRTEDALAQRAAVVDDVVAAYGADHWQASIARATHLLLARRAGADTLPEEVERAVRAAAAEVDAAADARTRDRAEAQGFLGTLLVERAMTLEGELQVRTFREGAAALERARSLLAEDARADTLEWADGTSALGLACKMLGRFDEAERHYREVVALHELRLPEDDVRRAVVWTNLAGLAQVRGDLEGAREGFAEAHAVFLRVGGPDALHTVHVEGSWLGTLSALGRHAGLVERYDALLPRQVAQFGPQSPQVFTSLERRGLARLAAGDAEGARADFEQALAPALARYGEGGVQVQRLRASLAALDAR